jgi:thymidylate kinase
VIIADRSVHTLLAHSYALEQMTGIRLFAPSVRLLQESLIPAWPDLVVYLDLPQDAVRERNNGKFPAGSIYTDPTFNAAVRTYFWRLAGQKAPHVMWLDATLDMAELARLTGLRVRQMAGSHDVEGAV